MNLRRTMVCFVAMVPISGVPVLSQNPPSQAAAPPTAQNGSAPTQIGAGVVIPAQLSKSVDAKKAKPGDKIEAKTTMDLLSHGQVVIPRDTKLIGHVTEAKPHSKESPESSVGLSFDRISLKDGREVPIKSSVQAIGRSLNSFDGPGGPAGAAPSDMPSSGAPDSRGTMGNSTRPSSPPSYPSSGPTQMPSGTTGGDPSPSGGVLDPHSQGVVGMKGLELKSAGPASVVSSNTNNVHLDSGTQLVLRTE
jgi:hypothetical protein